MKVIRGTGDAKKMKGNAQSVNVLTMRCTNCGQQAMKTRLPDGQEIYKCGACGTGFKASKF